MPRQKIFNFLKKSLSLSVLLAVYTMPTFATTPFPPACIEVTAKVAEQFDETSDCQIGGLIAAKKGSKWGYVDTAGNMVVPFVYDAAYDFEMLESGLRGVAIVQRGEKYGLVDSQGKLVVPLIYDNMTGFSDGLAAVEKAGKVGFITPQGSVAIPLQYRYASQFSGGQAVVGKAMDKTADEYKFGTIDTRGKVVLPLIYDNLGNFSHDGVGQDLAWVAVIKDNATLYGYLNRQGAMVIPAKFDDAEDFSEGRAAVQKDDKWGFINTAGKLVVPYRYDSVKNFKNGYSIVANNDLYGVINPQGKQVLPLIYDSISLEKDGTFLVTQDDDTYHVTKNNKRVKEKSEEITAYPNTITRDTTTTTTTTVLDDADLARNATAAAKSATDAEK